MARIKYREALNAALREEMERDPLVFIIGEGIGKRGGSYKVTENLLYTVRRRPGDRNAPV